MLEKLKLRWNIKSNFQVVIILVVFAITGSTTVVVKNYIFNVAGVTSETHLLFRIPFYIVVILSVYNVLLLLTGAVFGQFGFFLAFEKKFFSRLLFLKKRQPAKSIIQ
jgi:Mn2+/Fe2+ NRAMP family transporter